MNVCQFKKQQHTKNQEKLQNAKHCKNKELAFSQKIKFKNLYRDFKKKEPNK